MFQSRSNSANGRLEELLEQLIEKLDEHHQELMDKLDEHHQELTAKIDELQEEITAKLDEVHQEQASKLDDHSRSLDAISSETDKVSHAFETDLPRTFANQLLKAVRDLER